MIAFAEKRLMDDFDIARIMGNARENHTFKCLKLNY